MKGPNNYLKNVTKSITYVAMDVAKRELMEETMDFAESNKEFIATTYAALKNPVVAIRKGISAIQESKLYKAIDYGARNAIEDLRTGNFYNKERIERDTGKLSGLANADDWNDLSEFGIDDDWDDILNGDFDSDDDASSGITKEITSGDVEIVSAIEGTSAASTNATVNAVLSSSDMQIKNSRVNTGSLFLQNERLFGGLHKDITIIGSTIDSMHKITSTALENIDKNMSSFFTSESKLSAERNAILKEILEIQHVQYKPAIEKEKEIAAKTKKNKTRWSDINSSGMPELSDYFEVIKNNVMKEIGSSIPNLGNDEDSNMLAEFMVSPWQHVIEPVISGLIPASFKLASKELDKSLSSVFGQFIGRLGNNKGGNGLWGIVSKFLRVNTSVNKGIATDKYEKGPVPFDGIARKAIIDVIPSYLRRIEAFLTREPEQTFDYDTGKWMTMNAIKKRHEDIHKNAVKSGTREIMEAMKPALDQIAFSNKTDAESFDKAKEEFQEFLYDHNGIVNPYVNAEKNDIDFARYPNLYKHYQLFTIAYQNFDRTPMLTRGGHNIKNNNYSARLGIAKNVLDAKDAEERAYRDLESKIGPLQQFAAAISVDKHGKWDKDSGKFTSNSILLESKDKAGNTIFNYLYNMNAELTWQRKTGFEEIFQTMLTMMSTPNIAVSAENAENYTRLSGTIDDAVNRIIESNRNQSDVLTVTPDGIVAPAGYIVSGVTAVNNQQPIPSSTDAAYNRAFRNGLIREHDSSFDKIYASLNKNKDEDSRNNARQKAIDKIYTTGIENIAKGKAIDPYAILKEAGLDETDDEEDSGYIKEAATEISKFLNAMIEEENSKKYKSDVQSINSAAVSSFLSENFFKDNTRSYEDVRKEIEKAEKEAGKDKDSELDEKEKSFLSGLIEKVKAGSSFAGGIAGATADMFTNLMYTTDRAIYEMMYKTELKDEDGAEEYNGFMDMIAGKINKTFDKVGKDIKDSIIDPFKKWLGIDDKWEEDFKKSIGEIGSSIWKNFVDANKDVYGPLWGMVKTQLGFRDGETIAQKQRRATRRDLYEDLDIADDIKSISDLRYVEMLSAYGLNAMDYGTNFDAAMKDLREAIQQKILKNSDSLFDLSRDHADDDERRRILGFANSAQLLEIAAEHGIKEEEIVQFKDELGNWDDEGLRNYIESYIFDKMEESGLRKALNVINVEDENGKKRYTDEEIENIVNGTTPSDIDWQKETRDLIARNATDKIKDQTEESILSNILNRDENRERLSIAKSRAFGLGITDANEALAYLSSIGEDTTDAMNKYLDETGSISLPKVIERALADIKENEYTMIARNEGFQYNAEDKESNISQIVEAANRYNTDTLQGKTNEELSRILTESTQLYNTDKYNSARVSALGFTGSIDEKRAKLKELTGRSDEDLNRLTTDEQLDREYINYVDANNLNESQLAKTLGFESERKKQIEQIEQLARDKDRTNLIANGRLETLSNQELLNTFLELNGATISGEITKALIGEDISIESVIRQIGENIANSLRNNANLTSEDAWARERFRHTNKGMDTNYKYADLMGQDSTKEGMLHQIGEEAVDEVSERINIDQSTTGNFTDTFNKVNSFLQDGAKISEAEYDGLNGTIQEKRRITIEKIKADAERRKRNVKGNKEKIDAINAERDADIAKIERASEYDVAEYFVRHGFKNNALGTVDGKPFMGDTMLSKGELLFNSKGVSRVNKTDAYTLKEPTHILNSEDSYDLLSGLGIDKSILGEKSTIEQDLINENNIKEKIIRDLPNHAEGSSTLSITNKNLNGDKILSEAKSKLPELAAGGLVGGVLSLVFDLVGGPLVGAAVGAGANLIKNSDTLKNALFGKKIGENGERDNSGFINKTIVDNVRRAAPDMFKFGLAGIIPGLITGIGPIGGLLAGAAIGIIKNNEAFTNKYFGENGKLSIKSKDKEIIEKLIPGALKGAGAGAIAGLLFGGPFGLLGNAAIGSVVGMMGATSEFKEIMLGTDINGQREGGLLGILKEAFDPLIDAFDEVKSKLIGAIDENIVNPLERFISPAIHALPKLLSFVPKLVIDWIDKKTENIRRDLAGKIKDFILPKTEFVAKMLSPITSLVTAPLKIPGKIVGGIGDRLRRFDIKHGDTVNMSLSEAVEWMDEHNWGRDVDPLMRLAAGTRNKNDAERTASLLNAMNSTEEAAKRNFNDKNHNLNRLLEGYRTEDGRRLSKAQIKSVLKHAQKGDYKGISKVLTDEKLNGTNHAMSQADFEDLMNNKGLKSALGDVAEAHRRKEIIRTMSGGEITDEVKLKLKDLGINPSDFDIASKKDRAKLAKYLSEQAMHLEANPDEEHLEKDNHDNLDSMNDTLEDIYSLLMRTLLGEDTRPKEFRNEVDGSLDSGEKSAKAKYARAYKKIEQRLKNAGMETDKLSDKAKTALSKKYIEFGMVSSRTNNAEFARDMTVEFINMAADAGIDEFDELFFFDKDLQQLMTEEGMQYIAQNFNKTNLTTLYKWLSPDNRSEIRYAIIKGKYPLDADTLGLIGGDLIANNNALEQKCRLINQAKAWDKFKSLREIDNLSLNDLHVIRGNANVKQSTSSGASLLRDIGSKASIVTHAIAHPIKSVKKAVTTVKDRIDLSSAQSRVNSGTTKETKYGPTPGYREQPQTVEVLPLNTNTPEEIQNKVQESTNAPQQVEVLPLNTNTPEEIQNKVQESANAPQQVEVVSAEPATNQNNNIASIMQDINTFMTELHSREEPEQNIPNHGIGTFLLDTIGGVTKGAFNAVTGLFKNKKSDKEELLSDKKGLSNILSLLPFMKANEPNETTTKLQSSETKFDETDKPDDDRDVVQFGNADFGYVKKGSDGSIEPDTTDSKTKEIINKINLKDKLIEKAQQAQIKATEILHKAFDVSDNDSKNGKLKWWQIALTGAYLWKTGVLGKFYDGLVKPLWDNALKPWIVNTAVPWIINEFIPGIGEFFVNVGTGIKNIAVGLYTDVLKPTWTEHLRPWLVNDVGPWILNTALPKLGELIGNGVKFLVEALPAILKGSTALAGGIVDAFTGNKYNAGATTTINPEELTKDGNFTNEKGEALTKEDVQNGNYEKIYNSEGAEGVVGKDGKITFKDKSMRGASYLSTTANAAWHSFLNPNVGLKSAELLINGGNLIDKAVGGHGIVGTIIGKSAKLTGNAIGQPMKAAAKLGEKAGSKGATKRVFSRLFNKATKEGTEQAAESTIKTSAKEIAEETVENAAKNVAKETLDTTAKKSGLIAKLLSKVSLIIDKIFSNTKVGKFLANAAKELGESSVGKVAQKIKDSIMKGIEEAAEKAAKKIGLESAKELLDAALVVLKWITIITDFLWGFDRAASILGVTECNIWEKIVCGVVNVIINLIPFISIVVSPKLICGAIFKIIGGKSFEERQKEADAEYEKWKQETGSTKTKEEYLASQYSITGKAWDKTKEFAGKTWDKTKEFTGKAWDWAKKNGGAIASNAAKLGIKMVVNPAGTLANGAKYVAGSVWNSAKSAGSTIADGVVALKNSAVDAAKSAWESAIAGIKDTGFSMLGLLGLGEYYQDNIISLGKDLITNINSNNKKLLGISISGNIKELMLADVSAKQKDNPSLFRKITNGIIFGIGTISKLFHLPMTLATASINLVKDLVKKGIEAVTKFAVSIADKVMHGVDSVIGLFGFGKYKDDNIINLSKDVVADISASGKEINALAKTGDISSILNYSYKQKDNKNGSIFRSIANAFTAGFTTINKFTYLPSALSNKVISFTKYLIKKGIEAVTKFAVSIADKVMYNIDSTIGLFGFGKYKDDNITNLSKDMAADLSTTGLQLKALAKTGDVNAVLNYKPKYRDSKDGSIFRKITDRITNGIISIKKFLCVPDALLYKGINFVKEIGKQGLGLFGIGEYGDKNIINIGKVVYTKTSSAAKEIDNIAKTGDIDSLLKYKNKDSSDKSLSGLISNLAVGSIISIKKITNLPTALLYKGINVLSDTIVSGINTAKGIASLIKSVARNTVSIVKSGDVAKLITTNPFNNNNIGGLIGNVIFNSMKPALMVPTIMYKGILTVKDAISSIGKKMSAASSNDVESKIRDAKEGRISIFTSAYWSTPYDGSNDFSDMMQVIYNRIIKLGSVFTIIFTQAANKIKEGLANITSIIPEGVKEFFSDPIGYAKTHWLNWGSNSDENASNDHESNKRGNIFTNAISSVWNHITGRGTEYKTNEEKPKSKYGRGYSKQIDPAISNIRYNDHKDTEYQTIGDSGCGPAAAVNAIKAIHGKGTNEVVDAANYALKNGYKEKDGGTMPGFFNDYFNKNGLSSQTITNKTEIINNINSGAPTVLMGTDSNGVSSSTPYGSNPHYVTATGTDDKGHVIIQDPESKYDNQLYDINDVINKTQFGVSAFGRSKFGKGTEETIWNYLKNNLKMTDAGAAGLMGNLYAESSLKPNNLEGIYEKRYDMTDKSYTEAVDNGTYPKNKFVNDKAGYGLAQWTYKTRKKKLYEYIKNKGLSIASIEGQLGYLNKELKEGYAGVLNTLKKTNSLREASDAVMLKFERPKDTSEKKRQQRASYGTKYYNKFSGKTINASDLISSDSYTTSTSSSDTSIESTSNSIWNLGSLLSNFLTSLTSDNSSSNYSSYSISSDSSINIANTDQAKALVQVAQSQIGTKESGKNKIKYVDWITGSKGTSLPWCATFVAWCANQAGIPTTIIPKSKGASDMFSSIISYGGKTLSINNAQPGDLMFVVGTETPYEHVGIVESNKGGGKVSTIEGNYSDKVSRVTRPTKDGKKLVFVRPAYTKSSSTSVASSGTGSFPKYKLNDTQIKGVANIIQHEQPDMKGYLAEASLMANLTDIKGDKNATPENLVKKATGGWFANGSSRFKNPGNPKASAIQAAKTVLVEGKRTLPRYIDEHDCFSDITSATNNGKPINKKTRSNYKQHTTKVKNKYGSSWTFYEFPSSGSDPFGYTSSANRTKWGDFHYDASSLTSGYGTSTKDKPLAKYGQFKKSITSGKGSNEFKPIKTNDTIKYVNKEQANEAGKGATVVSTSTGNINNISIINLINTVIKVLYEIADNTDKLNTIISILNKNFNVNITPQDVSDNTGKYETLKSKLQKSLNNTVMPSSSSNDYANTVNNTSMSTVIEIMNSIASE